MTTDRSRRLRRLSSSDNDQERQQLNLQTGLRRTQPVSTGAGLAELHAADLRFITLRARNAKLTAALEALPDSAWTQITLERRGPYTKPEVCEHDVTVRGCPTPLRQIAVRGLGHDHPTLILTNDRTSPPKKIVGRYAKRMAIEQRLAESIRSFHLDALSSAVALNVDPTPP